MNKRQRPSCELQAPASMEHQLLEDLLKTSDLNNIDDTVKRIVDNQENESDKDELLRRSLALGRQLKKVSNRLIREYATIHNSHAWPFAYDLSVKIFSSLDTWDICRAAGTCTMFHKLSLDSSCYSIVDLTTLGSAVTDVVVQDIILRAGAHLRTLKLGTRRRHCGAEAVGLRLYSFTASWESVDCRLSKHCLVSLSIVAGKTLQSLHLYNVQGLDSKFLSKALIACPSLLELELVGMNVNMNTTISCLVKYCLKLENLSCASRTFPRQRIKYNGCFNLARSCSRITSLALNGYHLLDVKACALMKGLQHLKHVDFSEAIALSGEFLRTVPATMESLRLKDCKQLRQAEIEKFLYTLLDGKNQALRHLDISNGSLEVRKRPSSELIAKVQCLRPHVCLLAEYTSSCISSSDESEADEGVHLVSQEEYTSGESASSGQSDPSSDSESESEEGFAINLDEFLEGVSSGQSEDSLM